MRIPPLAKSKRAELVRRYLLNAIKAGDGDYLLHAMETFSLTRQAVHRHLSELVKLGFLTASGNTSARVYGLGAVRTHSKQLALKGLSESDVYLREFGFVFSGLPRELEDICHYGFTEMLNNAIDHSGGRFVDIKVARDATAILIALKDDGEGIFRHIARIMQLNDERESILELSKGKLTTDPENHTGQGIFFTSRAFDRFLIASGDLKFFHEDHGPFDILMHETHDQQGTRVVMQISLTSARTLKQVFDAFSDVDGDLAFNKTIVPVKLALYEGEQLISRSQAKRILNRVERFKTVILDFQGVNLIGQGFADEVFRVFAKRNPQIKLIPCNHNQDIERTIKAALAE
jgi:STAS-like domain of unknown function (DUF4325)